MALISQAVGRVATGFSLPWVARYAAEGNTVTYSDAQRLARGVNVSIDPESSDSNDFYADNTQAESETGVFNGGTASVEVDGLLRAAAAFISGLTAPASDTDWMGYGDVTKPFIGFGFVARYRSGGATSFVPYLLPKIVFDTLGIDLATQEEEIDWQPQTIEATIYRDDTVEAMWLYEGGEYATEAAAEAALKTKLGVKAAG